MQLEIDEFHALGLDNDHLRSPQLLRQPGMQTLQCHWLLDRQWFGDLNALFAIANDGCACVCLVQHPLQFIVFCPRKLDFRSLN